MEELVTLGDFVSQMTDNQIKLVYIYSPRCLKCRVVITPLLNRLSSEYSTFKFCGVNGKKVTELASIFKVKLYPVILFFKNGTIVDRLDRSLIYDKSIRDLLEKHE